MGATSPLATPYFLGDRLDHTPGAGDTPEGRGRALRQLFADAAGHLPADQQKLLDVAFLRRDAALNNTGVAMALGMSEATYYRRRNEAIEALALEVNRAAPPPLRSELPAPREMVGREQTLRECLDTLRRGQTVALAGGSGIGKTTLGIALARHWAPADVCWFTVRPGLNDHALSFVFTLAYFLRQHDASNTWRQVVADRGASDLTRALGLLRHDLSALAPASVLVCVDEVDLLRENVDEHERILHVIDELRARAPLLLVGQHVLLDAQQHCVLTGLNVGEVAALMARHGVRDLAEGELEPLRAATRGNPAMLALLATLRREGESLPAVMQNLAGAPSMQALLNRIWRRLDGDERALLMTLSVFRGTAPADVWIEWHAVLDRLAGRNLIEDDGCGGLVLPPHVREFMLRRMPPEAAPELHRQAADIHEARGNYTEAAHHYVEAGQPQRAVWIWWNHRELETERGRAPAARELFRHVRGDAFDDADDRRALSLLRSEQALANGEAEEVEAELNRAAWPASHPAAAYARQLRGDALEAQGRPEQALEQYRLAFRTASDTAYRQIVRLHTKAGYIYTLRLRDLERARREATMALWQALTFEGYVEEERGNYALARQQYEAALVAALTLENSLAAQAHIRSQLGHLLMRLGEADAAIEQLDFAIRHAEQSGEPVNALYDRLNLASAHIVAGHYDEALRHALIGLRLAEAMQHGFLIAGLAACAAEACDALQRFGEAEQYAMRSLREEEEVHRPYALTVLGKCWSALGRLDEAERALRSAIESAQATQDRYAEAPAWKALGQALGAGARGDRAAAEHAFAQALSLYEGLGLAREADALRIL
jgi:tetratricopeptide (TPR) repeat protein